MWICRTITHTHTHILLIYHKIEPCRYNCNSLKLMQLIQLSEETVNIIYTMSRISFANVVLKNVILGKSFWELKLSWFKVEQRSKFKKEKNYVYHHSYLPVCLNHINNIIFLHSSTLLSLLLSFSIYFCLSLPPFPLVDFITVSS